MKPYLFIIVLVFANSAMGEIYLGNDNASASSLPTAESTNEEGYLPPKSHAWGGYAAPAPKPREATTANKGPIVQPPFVLMVGPSTPQLSQTLMNEYLLENMKNLEMINSSYYQSQGSASRNRANARYFQQKTNK
jgi:hypothetical protein